MVNESLKQLLLGLYKMALCDNLFAPEEMAMLYKVAKEYGMSDEEVDKVVMDDNFTMYLPETLEGKVKLLYRFTQMAWADGVIVDEERELLKQTAIRYGFLRENAEAIVDLLLEKVKNNIPVEKVIEDITK